MADPLTHSHDTATPALSVESGEAMERALDAWWEGLGHAERCYRTPSYTMEAFRAGFTAAAAPAPNPSLAAKGGEAEAIERLKDAVEGECEGLALSDDQARAILAHVALATLSPQPALLDECWRDLVEKDDRMSPEEYADMALITKKELAGYLALATPSLQPANAVREATAPHADWLKNSLQQCADSLSARPLDLRGPFTLRAALASDPAPAGEAVEPVAMRNGVSAANNIAFWFFKDLTGGQRRNLFRVFGLPLEEIRSEHDERRCLKSILSDLEDTARLREDLAEAVRQIEANIAAIERSKEFVQKATALTQTAERERDDARKALVTVQEALKPFSDYADPLRTAYPDDMPMTKGSAIAARQVTAGDFRRAREAYHAAARSASREGASDE